MSNINGDNGTIKNRMSVLEQILENQVSLLKRCVEFYADATNYNELDGGFVAKETLKTVQILEDQKKKIINDTQQFSDMASQTTAENLMKEIEKIMNQ